MEEWKEYRLGDVSQIKGGKRLPKGVNLITSPNCHPYIRVRDLGTKKTIELDSSFEYVDDETQKSISRYTVEKGDIIISIVGTIGLVAIIGDSLNNANITENCVKIVNFNTVNREYLYYYLISKFGQDEIRNGTVGAVQAKLPIKNIQDIKVKAPSLFEQIKIASVLKSIDDKIEVNRRINENLEQQAQTLFKSWFVDFEPFKDGEFVESELGMIPKGWRVTEAQNVFEINIGKTPPRKEHEWFTESSKDNIWVSIADMGNCGVFISDSSEYLTDEAIKRFNIQMVEKDTILLSFKLTVGRVAIAATRLTTNEAIARFIIPEKCYREFLYLYLKQYKYGNLGSTSSIATAVNSKTIKGMKLLIPNKDIIERFSNKVRPLFEQICIKQQESRRLAELRDTLLPRLMSGEIKVGDVTL